MTAPRRPRTAVPHASDRRAAARIPSQAEEPAMSLFPPVTANMTFDHAARAALAFLRAYAPRGLWSVTRLESDRQTRLYLDDAEYGLPEGQAVPWEGSFSSSRCWKSSPTCSEWSWPPTAAEKQPCSPRPSQSPRPTRTR
jgi:hypothetical protein